MVNTHCVPSGLHSIWFCSLNMLNRRNRDGDRGVLKISWIKTTSGFNSKAFLLYYLILIKLFTIYHSSLVHLKFITSVWFLKSLVYLLGLSAHLIETDVSISLKIRFRSPYHRYCVIIWLDVKRINLLKLLVLLVYILLQLAVTASFQWILHCINSAFILTRGLTFYLAINCMINLLYCPIFSCPSEYINVPCV